MAKKTILKLDKEQAAERVNEIIPILKKTYPDAHTTLDHSNPLELLIATILAAQCTDARVNIVTKTLFKKYTSAQDWAKAPIEQIQDDIKTTGFYKNKAASIKKTCRMIIDNYKGQVPDSMEELLKLSGVGRKTANVILGNAFGIPGVVTDTHVIRLSRRLQLSSNSEPVKLEFDLMEIVPKKQWTHFSHLLVFHGRNICQARRPKCEICPIAKYCPAANNPDLW